MHILSRPLAVLLAIFSFAAASATPSASRGEHKFSIPYAECMSRAVNAFQANGWTGIGQGGAFVQAYKGAEIAYITCNQIDNVAFTFVNIFVASDNRDSNVPGAARVQLQAAMAGQVTAPQVASCRDAAVGNWTWAYAPPGQTPEPHTTVTLNADGSTADGTGNHGNWTCNGPALSLQWPGINSSDTLTLRDSHTIEGTNNQGWPIRGTR